MSDFVPRDMLPDLWEEILRRHWSFMDTEESIQKLEERKKLEGCLRDFLCVIPHDRKFFLPETAHVLRKSIREKDDFTAYKAIIGFESISQYANNLFTKPWRKEFHVLKMYSGFFQHEIKSNLIDAEKLFEAMGYRRLSDEVLVLDGPICPDQVTNVSRDAMAAYMECQIIKHIYAGLIALGLTCSWLDIFNFREKYSGGTTQAIKGLAYAIQDRQLRKEKRINTENCYATIQHSLQQGPNLAQCQNCQNCVPNQKTHQTQYQMQTPLSMSNGQCALHSNSCAMHPMTQQPQTNLMYNSALNGKLLSSYPAINYQQQQHSFVAPGAQSHMSHSRSLDHYNEPPALLPHRHSFDQQQQGCTAASHHYAQQQQQHMYESPYDCLDGVSMGSSVSYAAVAGAAPNVNAAYAHPYNVSGNRYPLPYNISNQLSQSHYATPTINNCNGNKNEAYGSVENRNCNYNTQPPLPPTRHAYANAANNISSSSTSAPASKDFQTFRQRSFPPDQQLIDFDDRAPLTSHDFHAQLHSLTQHNSFDCERQHMYEQRNDRRILNRGNLNANLTYEQPKDLVCPQIGPMVSTSHSTQLPSTTSDDSYVYARPHLKVASPMPQNITTDKYLRNLDHVQDCVDNNRKMQTELKDRSASNGASASSRRKLSTHNNERDASDLSYESAYDDFVNVGHSEHPQRSPTQASKNQDGVGSFESWDYVFQNLEKSGYSKDLGERGDLLVQSLDLDALNLTNGAAGSSATEKRRANYVEAKSGGAGRQQAGVEKSRTLEKTPTTSTTAKRDTIKSSLKQEKSILKQQNANATGTKKAAKSVLKSNGSNGNGTLVERNRRQSANSTTRTVPVSTQVIISSPNEWSCRFCTFLNPDTKRICEMCSRSKDFNLETSVSNTPTCV